MDTIVNKNEKIMKCIFYMFKYWKGILIQYILGAGILSVYFASEGKLDQKLYIVQSIMFYNVIITIYILGLTLKIGIKCMRETVLSLVGCVTGYVIIISLIGSIDLKLLLSIYIITAIGEQIIWKTAEWKGYQLI